MAESHQFDDIGQSASADRRDQSGVQGLIRVISCLPCFPPYVPPPETPNLNQV